MKYTTATLALLAGLAAAHDNPFGDSIPHCAADCIVAGVEAIGCTIEDTACACTPEKMAELTSNPEFTSCMTSTCSPEELLQAVDAGSVLCAQAGGDATGTDGAPAPTESGDSSSSDSAPAPTGAGNSTASAGPSGSDGADSPKPTGDSGAGGDDDSSDDAGGDDQGSDDTDGDNEGQDGSAAIPAVFGGAAILAALLAI